MSRITNAIIAAMKNKAVEKAGITAARAELSKRDEALTEAMRIASLGGQENYKLLMKLEAKFQELRKQAEGYVESGYSRLINKEYRVAINLAGVSITRYFYDEQHQQESRYAAHGRFVIEQGDPLVAEFYAIEDERKALENRADTIKASVGAAVSKVTTIKKLLELWPEAAELLPPAEQKTANLPVIQVGDLNAMIGLPTEQAAS